MGRTKIANKNVNVSISISNYQKSFLDSHPNFNLSKFVQIHLKDYINICLESEAIKQMLVKGGSEK